MSDGPALPPPPVQVVRRASLSDVMSPPSYRSPSRFSWAALKQRAISAAVGGNSADALEWSLEALPASFFELQAKDPMGKSVSLESIRGKVSIVCNVASF